MEGVSLTKEMAKNRLPVSRKLAEEIFKTESKVLQWPRKRQNWLWVQKQPLETLNDTGRCDPWKMLFVLHILLLKSCYTVSSVSFIGPGVGFGGNLPVEHPSAAPLPGSESSRVGGTVFWADVCGYRAVWALGPPAWHREERWQQAARLKCPLMF